MICEPCERNQNSCCSSGVQFWHSVRSPAKAPGDVAGVQSLACDVAAKANQAAKVEQPRPNHKSRIYPPRPTRPVCFCQDGASQGVPLRRVSPMEVLDPG